MNNQKLIKEALSYDLSSDLHEIWKAPRKLEDGSYEPSYRKSKDEEWNIKYNTDEADIANLPFKELPFNCKSEYIKEAEVAIDLVFDDIMNNSFNPNKIDKLAAEIYEEWKKNNDWVFDPDVGEPELAQPFVKIPKVEKDKARAKIIPAIQKVEDYKAGKINIDNICEKYGLSSHTKAR